MIHISIVIILSYLIGSIMPSIILTKKLKGMMLEKKEVKMQEQQMYLEMLVFY